jgi:hypothetical protein
MPSKLKKKMLIYLYLFAFIPVCFAMEEDSVDNEISITVTDLLNLHSINDDQGRIPREINIPPVEDVMNKVSPLGSPIVGNGATSKPMARGSPEQSGFPKVLSWLELAKAASARKVRNGVRNGRKVFKSHRRSNAVVDSTVFAPMGAKFKKINRRPNH